MKFTTQFDRPEKQLEKNNGKSVVEHSAYISTREKIESMIASGKQLVQNRQNQFDTETDSFDETSFDPTRNRGLDMAEVSTMEQQHTAMLEEIEEKISSEKEEKSKKLAQDKADKWAKKKKDDEIAEEKGRQVLRDLGTK